MQLELLQPEGLEGHRVRGRGRIVVGASSAAAGGSLEARSGGATGVSSGGVLVGADGGGGAAARVPVVVVAHAEAPTRPLAWQVATTDRVEVEAGGGRVDQFSVEVGQGYHATRLYVGRY